MENAKCRWKIFVGICESKSVYELLDSGNFASKSSFQGILIIQIFYEIKIVFYWKHKMAL